MKKSGFTFSSLILLAAFCAIALAQQPAQKDVGDCSQFKMRVVSPENETQLKMPVVKPVEGIDYKGEVVNPCALPGQHLAALPLVKSGPELTPGSAAPLLRLSPNSVSAESQLKTEFQLPRLKLKLIK